MQYPHNPDFDEQKARLILAQWSDEELWARADELAAMPSSKMQGLNSYKEATPTIRILLSRIRRVGRLAPAGSQLRGTPFKDIYDRLNATGDE